MPQVNHDENGAITHDATDSTVDDMLHYDALLQAQSFTFLQWKQFVLSMKYIWHAKSLFPPSYIRELGCVRSIPIQGHQ